MVSKLRAYSVNELTSLQRVRQESLKLIKIYKQLQDDIEDQCEHSERISQELEQGEERIRDLISRTYRINKLERNGKFILCSNKSCKKADVRIYNLNDNINKLPWFVLLQDLGNHNMCRDDCDAFGSFLKFDMLGNTCRYCGCDRRYHFDVKRYTIKQREVDRRCEELAQEALIKRHNNKIQLVKCKIGICELKNDKQALNHVLSKISIYIAENSITSSNDISMQIILDIKR